MKNIAIGSFPVYSRKKAMKQEELRIIYEALTEAQGLIDNEIDCVIDEELFDDYQSALNKLSQAIEIVKGNIVT